LTLLLILISVFTLTFDLRYCYKTDGNTRNAECPVCSKNLNRLGQHLPYAHCANSKLICHISGQPLNEHNPPMMMPNGYVYGCNVSVVVVFVNYSGRLWRSG